MTEFCIPVRRLIKYMRFFSAKNNTAMDSLSDQLNPNLENRNSKQSQILKFKCPEQDHDFNDAVCCDCFGRCGIRISDLFRISRFEFRILSSH